MLVTNDTALQMVLQVKYLSSGDDIGLLTRDMSVFYAISLLPVVRTERSTQDTPNERQGKGKAKDSWQLLSSSSDTAC